MVPFHVSFTKPLELRTGSKSGGLSDDVLSKSAKDYFYASSDKGARAAALEDATPEQRKVLAQQLRDEVMEASSTSPYASQMGRGQASHAADAAGAEQLRGMLSGLREFAHGAFSDDYGGGGGEAVDLSSRGFVRGGMFGFE